MNIGDKYYWMGDASQKNKRIFTLTTIIRMPLFDLYKLQDQFGGIYEVSPNYIEDVLIKIPRRKISWALR